MFSPLLLITALVDLGISIVFFCFSSKQKKTMELDKTRLMIAIMKDVELNVLGQPLQLCCAEPLTGWFRDGFCRTDAQDYGSHVVCAVVTDEFLEFTRSRGNDLQTPRPEYRFPGLKAGDRWCLCALRWREAWEAGLAPPVVLESTHLRALDFISLEILSEYAHDSE